MQKENHIYTLYTLKNKQTFHKAQRTPCTFFPSRKLENCYKHTTNQNLPTKPEYKSRASHPNHFLFHTITTIIPTHLGKPPHGLLPVQTSRWLRVDQKGSRGVRGAGSRARLRSRVHAPPTSITRGVVGEERVVVGGGGREVARRKRDRRVGRAPVGPRDVTRAESISTEPYLRRRSLTTREIQSRSVRGGLHDR